MEAVIILQIITVIFIPIIVYYYKREQSRRDEYEKETKSEIKEMKNNYLDRFDSIGEKIMSSERRIVDKFMEYFKR